MFATDFPSVTIPSWVERVALPKYPIMPLSAYVLLGIGALLLLIGYFTPIKKLPALMTALSLMAYYPLAYLALWFLFRFQEQERTLREPNKVEEFLFRHTRVLDWSLLGLCGFFGFVFLVWTVWATIRKRRRAPVKETSGADNPFGAQPAPQPVARPQPTARPAAPRPTASPPAPPPKKVPKKPASPPSSDNPFDFG
jgi:hypothetical protein